MVARMMQTVEAVLPQFATLMGVFLDIARKQAKAPWSITADDVAELTRHFGRERAMDVIWWSCRCHYMTRAADAFQLPLERENVFSKSAVTLPKGSAKGNRGIAPVWFHNQ
jgi:hypothetical protein